MQARKLEIREEIVIKEAIAIPRRDWAFWGSGSAGQMQHHDGIGGDELWGRPERLGEGALRFG